MTRRFASRYWSSLTGGATAPAPRPRGQAGYSFWRRYVAALLGVSLPFRTAPAPRRKRVPARRTWALATGLSLAMAFGGLAIVFTSVFTGSPPGDGGLSVGAEPPLPVTFTQGDTSTVSQCENLDGSGEVPREGAAVLMVTGPDNVTRYGATLKFTDDRWEAEVVIGTEADAGQTFELRIYATSAAAAARLEDETNAMEPDQFRLLDSTTVTRTDEPGAC